MTRTQPLRRESKVIRRRNLQINGGSRSPKFETVVPRFLCTSSTRIRRTSWCLSQWHYATSTGTGSTIFPLDQWVLCVDWTLLNSLIAFLHSLLSSIGLAYSVVFWIWTGRENCSRVTFSFCMCMCNRLMTLLRIIINKTGGRGSRLSSHKNSKI